MCILPQCTRIVCLFPVDDRTPWSCLSLRDFARRRQTKEVSMIHCTDRIPHMPLVHCMQYSAPTEQRVGDRQPILSTPNFWAYARSRFLFSLRPHDARPHENVHAPHILIIPLLPLPPRHHLHLPTRLQDQAHRPLSRPSPVNNVGAVLQRINPQSYPCVHRKRRRMKIKIAGGKRPCCTIIDLMPGEDVPCRVNFFNTKHL